MRWLFLQPLQFTQRIWKLISQLTQVQLDGMIILTTIKPTVLAVLIPNSELVRILQCIHLLNSGPVTLPGPLNNLTILGLFKVHALK